MQLCGKNRTVASDNRQIQGVVTMDCLLLCDLSSLMRCGSEELRYREGYYRLCLPTSVRSGKSD